MTQYHKDDCTAGVLRCHLKIFQLIEWQELKQTNKQKQLVDQYFTNKKMTNHILPKENSGLGGKGAFQITGKSQW